MTNILRDVKNDAARGRIYLPLSELKKFGVSEAQILNSQYSESYFALVMSVDERARQYYRLARQGLPPEDRRAMVAAELMGSVYWQLLLKLERNQFNVFGPKPQTQQAAQAGVDFQIPAAPPHRLEFSVLWHRLKCLRLHQSSNPSAA